MAYFSVTTKTVSRSSSQTLLRNLVDLEVVSRKAGYLAGARQSRDGLLFTVTAFASRSPFRQAL
jgi:hypothetical protein